MMFSFVRSSIRNSAIINWFAGKTESVDIFSNSIILKRLLRLSKEVVFTFHNRNVKVIASFLLLLILACCGWLFSWEYCIAALLLIALFILIWKKAEYGIVMLIFSFALTPKIHIGQINSVIVPLRIDDLLLVIIALVTLFKMSLGKVELKSTSLDAPILFFLVIVIISTFRAILIHTTDKPIINLLYVSKLVEYFMIFYLTIHIISDEKRARLCLMAIVVSSIIVSLIGIWEHFHPSELVPDTNYYRIYERGLFDGESNHFGAYFVFLLGIAGGFILFSSGLKSRVYWTGYALLALFPLLWTYSRQSYLAFAGPIISLPLFKKNRKYFIRVVCILIVLLIIILSMPWKISERLLELKEALLLRDPYKSSFAYRLNRWQAALLSFREYPLLGTGFGSRHRAFYESNHVLVLSEMGIVGYGLFLCILLVVLREGLYLFHKSKAPFYRSLAAGFIAGFLGLLLHSIVCNTFIITRIAGPFWVVAGLVFAQTIKASHSQGPYQRGNS